MSLLKKQQGSTLLEVLCGMVVLGLCFVGSQSAILAAVRYLNEVEQASEALFESNNEYELRYLMEH